MAAYYNEIDPFAAQWLRNLIAAGHIAPGDVDERSIEDVRPDDIKHYTQCHFFAGIGVWSYALRQAGWRDSDPVWTGSCPCQPFSTAGQGAGFNDERHLWPAWFQLIAQCRPSIVFGEQVASKDADAWVDLVHTDMEAMAYAFGCVPFPAAGVGAPNERERTYWVAHANNPGEFALLRAASDGAIENVRGGTPMRSNGQMAGRYKGQSERFSGTYVDPAKGDTFWSNADWLRGRDGLWRPVEPGTFPLAHGATGRVGRLRAYGNAINAIQAQTFIEAYLETL